MKKVWILAVMVASSLVVRAETQPVAAAETNQASVAAPVTPAPAAPEAVQAEVVPAMEEGFPMEKFSIGTRVAWFELETTRKNTFLGHIDELEAIQDDAPTKVYADWWFHRYAGVEVSIDRVEARTHNDDPEGISDGNLLAEGFVVALLGRYPNKTRVTPFAGAGIAFMSISFEEEPWWALGYDSPESYEMLGSPSVPRGKTREMLPEDSSDGVVVAAGADIRLFRHVSANLYWRYMELDTKMGYRTAGETKAARDIPMSSMAYGFGVKYVF